MRVTTKKLAATAGIVSAGGLSLGLIGSGVGANFVKAVTGNANISVGNLDCQLSPGPNASGVTISNDGHTATIDLAQIESSAPGSSTEPVVLTNTGTMPLYVNWETATSGSIFNSGAVSAHQVPEGVGLQANAAHTYDLGFDWTALSNADLGTSGTVTYTANCTDTRADLALFQQDGGTAAWNSDGTGILLGIPANPQGGAAGGIQVLGQSTTLPTTEPTFTTDNYAAGSPRWYIQVGNSYIFGYPSQSNLGASRWEEGGSNTYVPWSTILTDFAGQSVSSINILMDADQVNVTDTISQIQYNGHELLKS